jgi:hypothetical protein
VKRKLPPFLSLVDVLFVRFLEFEVLACFTLVSLIVTDFDYLVDSLSIIPDFGDFNGCSETSSSLLGEMAAPGAENIVTCGV